MKIGYLSFRPEDQSRDARRAALERMQCDRIVEQEVEYQNNYREALQHEVEALSPEDTLIVWSFKSLGLKAREIVNLLDDFEARNIKMISIRDQIDTGRDQSIGRFCRILIAVDAYFHRTMTREGLKNAGLQGAMLGRPSSIDDDKRIAIEAMLASKVPKRRIAKHFTLSRSTLDRFISNMNKRE